MERGDTSLSGADNSQTDQWLLVFSQVAEITMVFLRPWILAYHVSWDPALLPSVAFVSQANIDRSARVRGNMLSKMR